MSEPTDLYTVHDDHVVVNVHVQPRAGRTTVVGRHGHALKLRVAAPPADGRANDAVVTLLAETFGVEGSAVTIVSGATSRTKAVRVAGIEPDAVGERLRVALEAADKESGVGPARGARSRRGGGFAP